MAIERERYEQSLKAALGRQEVLLKETRTGQKQPAIVQACSNAPGQGSERSGVDPAPRKSRLSCSAVAKAHERHPPDNGPGPARSRIYC